MGGIRRLDWIGVAIVAGAMSALAPMARAALPNIADGGIVLHGTVVTMDAQRSILHNGGVFIRGDSIVATWQGSHTPPEASSAVDIDLGPKALIFPGLINLHDHPTYDVLSSWPAPSSHRQPQMGRPLGSEPYANRYQWNPMMGQAPLEYRRLVDNPQKLLTSPVGLGLGPQVVKYAEIRAALGGETTIQGGSDPIADQTLIRNVEAESFSGPGRIASSVAPIDALADADRIQLLTRMQNGDLDAWLVHLAEGVRDAERRPGDPISSRAEFATLQAKGLLTDATVILHGVGLEPEDFAAMSAAPSIRLDRSGDGLGAKLVWSPLSNLLLYGRTASVYEALAAGVLVSLGTDWSPSGSRNLLDELKVADIALRDPRVLGNGRDRVPELSITGKSGDALENAEIALDRMLVEMVTVNPAQTLRWSPFLGSVERGKRADLLLITQSTPRSSDLPDSPYRELIEAGEEDVRLVLVNGQPLAGDVAVMEALKPGDYEVITSPAGCFEKAIDVTDPSVPQGTQTFDSISAQLRDALTAMGGDHPPLGGGPAPLTNTYHYLKAHIPGAGGLGDAQFTQLLASRLQALTPDGLLNLEAIQLSPVLIDDDDFFFHLLNADVGAAGLIADDTPPFKLYPANFNHVGPLGNPLAATQFQERYFDLCSGSVTQAQRISKASESARATSPIVTPNPARSRMRFAVDGAPHGSRSVDLYDVAGRRVRTIPGRDLGGGRFECEWNLEDAAGVRVAPGVYLARCSSSSASTATRLVVLP